MSEDLIGTRGAYILDQKLNILGKVPTTELLTTIKSLGSGVNAVVFDGSVDRDLQEAADSLGVKYLVGMDSKVRSTPGKATILTINEL